MSSPSIVLNESSVNTTIKRFSLINEELEIKRVKMSSEIASLPTHEYPTKDDRSEVHLKYLLQTVFGNQLILENIFKYLSVTDLKEARAVAMLWNCLAGPELMKRAWFSIVSDEDECNNIGHSIRFLRTISFLPKKFKLAHMTLHDNNLATIGIAKFMRLYGKFITALNIRRCIVSSGGIFWTNIIYNGKWTPNLRELILEESSYVEHCTRQRPVEAQKSDGKQDVIKQTEDIVSNHIEKLTVNSDQSFSAMPCKLSDFWELFPHLKTLILLDMEEEENQELLEAAIPNKRNAFKPELKLTTLDIFSESQYSVRQLPRGQLRLLCGMNLCLTKLTIDIGENILPADFEYLLRSLQPTLKTLIVWRGLLAPKMSSPGFPYGVELPVLEHLEIPESTLENFKFIYFIPKVQYLVIRQCDLNPIPYETNLFAYTYRFQDWKKFVLEPHQALKELVFEFNVGDGDVEFFRGIFPNLLICRAFMNRTFSEEKYCQNSVVQRTVLSNLERIS